MPLYVLTLVAQLRAPIGHNTQDSILCFSRKGISDNYKMPGARCNFQRVLTATTTYDVLPVTQSIKNEGSPSYLLIPCWSFFAAMIPLSGPCRFVATRRSQTFKAFYAVRHTITILAKLLMIELLYRPSEICGKSLFLNLTK